MNKQERRTIDLHNEFLRRNQPPAPIPEPVDDLQALINEYNQVEE